MNKTIPLSPFVKGINNVAKETNIPEGFLREALNVDIDKEGVIRRRSGYTKVYSGVNCHSLYRGYFVESGELKKLNDDYTADSIINGLDPNRYLSYCEVNNRTAYTNGRVNGYVDGTSLSVPNPDGQPALTETTGRLLAGTYSVAICLINDTTGEMSGTDKARYIYVDNDSGILLTGLPNNGYNIAIFASNTNGEQLFLNAVVPAGTTSFTIISTNNGGRALDTQFMSALPAGQLIEYHDGRLYVADRKTLWFSQPMRLGLCKKSQDFFQFKSDITILLAVENGLFVVADKAYFLTGGVVKDMTLKEVHRSTGISGTGIKLDSHSFGLDFESEVAYWYSPEGAVIGLPDGTAKSITDNNVAIDTSFIRGASMYREIDGIKQVLTSLNGGGPASNFAASDRVTSTIIRNGVVIQ